MGIEPTCEAWEARNKNREYVLKSGAVEPGEPGGYLFRFGDSFPSTKDGREYAWASATVEHGEYKERLFVGCVGDKIFADRLKTHRR
jgi:hypothetical protein